MEYSPRRRPAELNDLRTELIRNAAFVAHEGRKAFALARWRAKSEKHRVVYVFDTDVIVAHCAPWRTGPADDKFLGRGYGQVLPQKPLQIFSAEERQQAISEERRRAEVVCWLLASKAVERALDQEFPILQTTSHFQETLRVYEAVKLRAAAEVEASRSTALERQNLRFDEALQLVRRAVARNEWPLDGNPGRFLGNILNRMQAHDTFRTSRFVREWDSFLDLIRRGSGIFQLHEFRSDHQTSSDRHDASWSKVSAALREPQEDRIEERSALEVAIGKIVAPNRYQHGRDRLDTDVKAIADVIIANRLLAESGDHSTKVVLVTGDRKIVLALALATKDRLPGSDDGTTISDFAFDCVHHLWSLVDTIPAKSDDANGSVSRSELFSGLLAFDDEKQDDRSFVMKLASYAVSAEPSLSLRLLWNDIERAYERWDDYSEAAASFHRHFLLDRNKSDQISEILIEKFRSSNVPMDSDRLHAMVVDTIERARDRTNVELSEIGANSILDAHRHGVRNPPDLMFDSLTTTDRIFRDLALPKRVFMDSKDFAQRFERIVDDCYQPAEDNLADDDYRQECYLKYLVLGALFASANRWMVAEQHAESAVKIVQRAKVVKDPIRTRQSSTRKSNMSGREAYFLLAAAKRVRARTSKDYEAAGAALRRAEQCWNEDRSAGTAVSVPRERFDCERLALALARYYNARKNDSQDPCNALADDVLRYAMGPSDALIANLDRTDEDFVTLPVSTQAGIATNLLQVAAISRFRAEFGFVGKMISPVNDEVIAVALATLVRHTNLVFEIARARGMHIDIAQNDDKQIICSSLMMFYAVAVAVCYDLQTIWTPVTSVQVEKFFASRDPVVTDYDKWRFVMLKTLMKRFV